MRLPEIDTVRCTGCGWCVAACPPKVLSLQASGWRKHAVLHDAGACTGCRVCSLRCPFDAIRMDDERMPAGQPPFRPPFPPDGGKG